MSHRYYSPLRPLSLGTFPKPQGNEILHIENFEERQNVPEIARKAWGYIEYKISLSFRGWAVRCLPSIFLQFYRIFCIKALTIYQSWYIIKSWKGDKNK